MENRITTVSDQTRTEVWHAFGLAKRCAAYYRSLHSRYTRYHQAQTGLVTTTVSFCFLLAFYIASVGRTGVPEWIFYVILGLLVLKAIDFAVSKMLGNHVSKRAIALSIAQDCDGVGRRLSELISEIDGGGIDESRTRLTLTRILQDISAITYRSDIGIVGNENLENLKKIMIDELTELSTLYGAAAPRPVEGRAAG